MASKLTPKEWKNVNYTTWHYEEQTKLKHSLLKHYIPTWFSILGKYNERLNYIDCFGGHGAYHNEEDLSKEEYDSKNFGSPIIAIKHIIELQKIGRIKTGNVVIIDEDKGNIENIKKILQEENLNFNPVFICGDFDKEVNEMLDNLDRQKKSLTPTFFFVDPFGFKIKHSTILRLLSVPKSEVLLNFMFTRINEFMGSQSIENTINDLFGSDEWKSCLPLKGNIRERELISCYRNQFKKHGYYVVPYKFEFPEQKRTYYYLFHITKHVKGCSVLKDIFSKLASLRGGVMEFQSKKRVTLNLFSDLPAFKRTDKCSDYFCFKDGSNGCEDCIFDRFSNRHLLYEEFIGEVIDEVPLKQQGIKDALRELEKEGKLQVTPSRSRKSKRRGGFKDDDVLYFKSK